MRAGEFIEYYKPEMSEYCPIVIDYNGDIYECPEGHLHKLVELSGDAAIMNEIPKDESPLMYLTGRLRCVIVDYENQIYMEELSDDQSQALEILSAAGLIKSHTVRMTYKSVML